MIELLGTAQTQDHNPELLSPALLHMHFRIPTPQIWWNVTPNRQIHLVEGGQKSRQINLKKQQVNKPNFTYIHTFFFMSHWMFIVAISQM